MSEYLSSVHNPLIKKVMELGQSSKARAREARTIVEGKNVLTDLGRYRTPEMVFYTEQQAPCPVDAKKCYMVSDQVMQKISTVESPEGILALLPIEEKPLEQLLFPCLILDGLQDPGNVGTLLRTAIAFGVKNVVCIEPCCDLWHPKVMRSAKGAHYFFQSMVKTSWEQLLSYCQKKHVTVFTASLEGTKLEEVLVPNQWALALGSEAKGLTLHDRTQTVPCTIPIAAEMESLNVAQAGAIFLYFFTIQK